MKYSTYEEVEAYIKSTDSVKMLVILDEKNESYENIRDRFLKMMKNHEFTKAGIEHFHWYLGEQYLEYKSPALLVKNKLRAIS